MSKHRVLSFKPQLRPERRGQHGQNETEQPDHSTSLSDSIAPSIQIGFSVHTRFLNDNMLVQLTMFPLRADEVIRRLTSAIATKWTPDRMRLTSACDDNSRPAQCSVFHNT